MHQAWLISFVQLFYLYHSMFPRGIDFWNSKARICQGNKHLKTNCLHTTWLSRHKDCCPLIIIDSQKLKIKHALFQPISIRSRNVLKSSNLCINAAWSTAASLVFVLASRYLQITCRRIFLHRLLNCILWVWNVTINVYARSVWWLCWTINVCTMYIETVHLHTSDVFVICIILYQT